MQQEPSFADIAVSLALAMPAIRIQMQRAEDVGRRVTMSDMGIEVALIQLRQDMRNIERGLELLKALAEVEPQARALIARKERGSWLQRLPKVAAL